jgi:hypothetical protein
MISLKFSVRLACLVAVAFLFLLVGTAFADIPPGPHPPANTPEPSTLALLFAGALGIAGWAWWRRKR